MDQNLVELNKLYEQLEDYQDMLNKMPENSVLGRLCIESYIRKTQKQIDKLKEQ